MTRFAPSVKHDNRGAARLRRATPRVGALAGALAALLVLGGGCALYGFDGGGFDLPISATHAETVPIDLSQVPGSGQVAPMRVEHTLTLPSLPVDLASQSSELDANKDKLERLEIRRILVTPTSNSLPADTNLPSIDLMIGPFQGSGGEAVRIATIPSIPGGVVGEAFPAAIDQAGTDAAQPYLTSLQFDFVPEATLVVEQGQSIPSGRADLEIKLTIQATVDPTK